MGDAKTFSDFLEWGLKTYPAEHTMLIMSDHGGPGTGGLCYDPYYDNDCITINELEYYAVGEFDDSNLELVSIPKRKCANDAYKFPETETKKLSKEELLKLASMIQANEKEE